MRREYYKLISDNNIRDFFSLIPEMSYSKKTKILERLLREFHKDAVNMALNQYEQQYVNKNRVEIPYMDRVLRGLAKHYNDKFFKIKEVMT